MLTCLQQLVDNVPIHVALLSNMLQQFPADPIANTSGMLQEMLNMFRNMLWGLVKLLKTNLVYEFEEMFNQC
jgi:hypothetical protein